MHGLVEKHRNQKNIQKRHKLINRLIVPIAIIQPLMTIPQIMTIFVNKSASDVSIVTWVAYEIGSSLWLYFGVVHKIKSIIITQTLWLIIHSLMIIGILLYK